jgi:hypothetical protein
MLTKSRQKQKSLTKQQRSPEIAFKIARVPLQEMNPGIADRN